MEDFAKRPCQRKRPNFRAKDAKNEAEYLANDVIDRMQCEITPDEWTAKAAEALEHLASGLNLLDTLGCDLSAASLSQAVDALKREIAQKDHAPVAIQ